MLSNPLLAHLTQKNVEAEMDGQTCTAPTYPLAQLNSRKVNYQKKHLYQTDWITVACTTWLDQNNGAVGSIALVVAEGVTKTMLHQCECLLQSFLGSPFLFIVSTVCTQSIRIGHSVSLAFFLKLILNHFTRTAVMIGALLYPLLPLTRALFSSLALRSFSATSPSQLQWFISGALDNTQGKL